jgi:hypothetical protein
MAAAEAAVLSLWVVARGGMAAAAAAHLTVAGFIPIHININTYDQFCII